MSEQSAKLIEIRDDKKPIGEISEKTQKILAQEHHIKISLAEAIPTIAYVFLREAINYLNKNKASGQDVEINLMQLFDMGISFRESDGEKEGNFTPYLTPGQEFKLLVKNDEATEDE